MINREQAQAAHEAGARFIVCPGMIEEVVIWAQEYQVPVLAGAVTPTEMIRGLRLENAAQYLQDGKIHAIGGSWMAKRQMIAAGNFDEITRLAKEASDLAKQIRG